MNSSAQKSYGQLEKLIISFLAEKGELTAENLYHEFFSENSHYTLQAIYHVLRKLRKQGIVIKVKFKFSLSLAWALDLVDLARRIEQKVLSSIRADQTIPEKGQKKNWSFSSLVSLDAFWVQLMLLLFQRSNIREMYNYCPHPWFYYARQNNLEKFYQILEKRNCRVYVIIGGKTYLDRQFSKAMSPKLYSCKHSNNNDFGKMPGRHIMLIGDYVIDVNISSHMAFKIDSIFNSTTNIGMDDLQKLQHLLFKPVKARLKVSNDPKRAKQIAKVFQELF